jgi:hypothetical protein
MSLKVMCTLIEAGGEDVWVVVGKHLSVSCSRIQP